MELKMTEIDFHVEPDAWIPIADMRQKFHERNSQVRTELEMEAIKDSIRQEGFTAEIIILNSWNDKLVSGHGRTEACWQLGYRGKLPVIYKNYPSELDHRLAMLRWNRARGHMNIEDEQRELVFLLDAYPRSEIERSLAYMDETLNALVPGLSAPQTLEQLAAEYGINGDRDFWPWIAVSISPEAMAMYQSFLDDLPGLDEAWKIDQILRAVSLESLQ